jgi:hypothetical protein
MLANLDVRSISDGGDCHASGLEARISNLVLPVGAGTRCQAFWWSESSLRITTNDADQIRWRRVEELCSFKAPPRPSRQGFLASLPCRFAALVIDIFPKLFRLARRPGVCTATFMPRVRRFCHVVGAVVIGALLELRRVSRDRHLLATSYLGNSGLAQSTTSALHLETIRVTV